MYAWGHDIADLLTPDDMAAFERYAHHERRRRMPAGYTEQLPF